jgi:small subunit ribosomal protein S12e
LAESCEEPQYKKLITALCNEHQIPLIRVDSHKKLGEWSGLCKIDKEGKPRKICGSSCVVIKVSSNSSSNLMTTELTFILFYIPFQDFGEETPALDIIKDHLRSSS